MKARFLYPPKPNSTGTSPFDPGFLNIAKVNKNFAMELKIDGWAAEVIKDNEGNYHYFNRHKEKLNTKFISQSIAEFESLDIPNNTVLGFEAVGNRSIKVKDKMIFYGVYMYNGELMNTVPYDQNKTLLKKLIPQGQRVFALDHYSLKDCNGDFIEKFKELQKIHLADEEIIEGIILKDITKPILVNLINSKILSYWCKFRINNGRRKL